MPLIRRVPWTVQPQSAVRLDRSKPITAGLRLSQIYTQPTPLDGVINSSFAWSGSTDLVITPNRYGLGVLTATSSQRQDFSTNTRTQLPASSSFSLRFVFTLTTTGTLQALYRRASSDGLYVSTGNKLNWYNGGAFTGLSVSALTTGVVYDVVAVNNAGTYSFWINGLLDASGITGPGTNAFVNGYTLWGDTFSQSLRGNKFQCQLWDRALSDSEIAGLAASPWQLFEPRRIIIPVSAGAGGSSYTLTAAAGAYTLTGQDAALRTARKLTAAQGGYSIAGQSAGLKRAYPLVAAQGSYTLTGQSAALRAARKFTAGQGSYTLNGQAATLTYTPAAGAYVLAANQGSYALTGQAAGLRCARRFLAAQGSYSLTGQAAGVKRGLRLAAAQGAYSLTGQAAGIRAARGLLATTGAYALTGRPATLTYAGSGGGITIDDVLNYVLPSGVTVGDTLNILWEKSRFDGVSRLSGR